MAEQPSQASCKEFHGCALPHPTARSLKTAKGELASLSNAQIGFPDLDPASRPKLRYRFLCQVSPSLACRPTQLHVWWPNNGVHLWHDQEDLRIALDRVAPARASLATRLPTRVAQRKRQPSAPRCRMAQILHPLTAKEVVRLLGVRTDTKSRSGKSLHHPSGQSQVNGG